MRVRRSHIRESASLLLSKYPEAFGDDGVNPELIAQKLGLDVRCVPLEKDYSGFLVFEGGKAYIGVNATESRRRQKFTIAHEIGHYILHERTLPYIDKMPFKIVARNERSRSGEDLREVEANLFAAELLMPADIIKERIQGIGEVCVIDDHPGIRELADYFGVSVRAMTVRLERLGFLSAF